MTGFPPKVTKNQNTDPLTPEILNSIIGSKTIYSSNVSDSFKIYISLPENYDKNRVRPYPVVYYLDGNNLGYHYIIREFIASELIPEVISVSIGYPGENQRTRDYTSGFGNFYAFMKNELIPYIDGQYNTDKRNRTLFGHSYGGLCCLQALFQDKEYKTFPFLNIIPSSPSIWWPDGVYLFNCEQTLYNTTRTLPVNVYMTMGSEEPDPMVPDFNRMSGVLLSRNYSYFNFMSVLNPGESHGSNSEVSFRNGIQWALSQSVPLPLTTDVSDAENDKLRVYPNPAHDVLTVDTKGCFLQNSTVEMVNMSGRIVFRKVTDLSFFTIDVSLWPRGMYLLNLSSKTRQVQQKVILK